MAFVSKEGRKVKLSNPQLNRVKTNETVLQILSTCSTVNANFWNCGGITRVRNHADKINADKKEEIEKRPRRDRIS